MLLLSMVSYLSRSSMKNILLISISFLAIGTLTYISMRMKNEPISDLALANLANIEALAQNEGNDVDCPNNVDGCYNGLWYPCKREVYN